MQKLTGFSQEIVHPRRHRHFFLLTVPKTNRTVTSMPTRVPERDFCDAFHPEYVQLVPLATNDGAGGGGRGGERVKGFIFVRMEADSASTFTEVNTY